MGKPMHSLIGRRFGKLTVNNFAGTKNHNSLWECECDCGENTVKLGTLLVQGKTKSCGCLRKDAPTTHNLTKSKTYRAWINMKARCDNPNNKDYKYYGGKGVKMCKRWNSFESFLADMGEAPEGLTIERIDNDGDYEPRNCRWDSRGKQMRNTRITRNISHDGKIMCLKDWADQIGIKPCTLQLRLRKWPLEKALTTPKLR